MRHTVSRATLTLAVIAVVISRSERLLDVDRVGDGFAETVTGNRHFGREAEYNWTID